jgi:DNA-binding MarR family transcriptional regulator
MASGTRDEQAAHDGVLAILRAADRLRRAVAVVVESRGLTLQQFNVLRILRGAGEPVATLDIALRMIEQAPGVTRLLDRLEKKALVQRERCPKDRRRVYVRITRGGLDLLSTLDGPVTAAEGRLMGTMPRTELRGLSRTLARLDASNDEAGAARHPKGAGKR